MWDWCGVVQYTLVFNVAGLKSLNTKNANKKKHNKKKRKRVVSTKVGGCFFLERL